MREQLKLSFLIFQMYYQIIVNLKVMMLCSNMTEQLKLLTPEA